VPAHSLNPSSAPPRGPLLGEQTPPTCRKPMPAPNSEVSISCRACAIPAATAPRTEPPFSAGVWHCIFRCATPSYFLASNSGQVRRLRPAPSLTSSAPVGRYLLLLPDAPRQAAIVATGLSANAWARRYIQARTCVSGQPAQGFCPIFLG
jgi:hypothetical protein